MKRLLDRWERKQHIAGERARNYIIAFAGDVFVCEIQFSFYFSFVRAVVYGVFND